MVYYSTNTHSSYMGDNTIKLYGTMIATFIDEFTKDININSKMRVALKDTFFYSEPRNAEQTYSNKFKLEDTLTEKAHNYLFNVVLPHKTEVFKAGIDLYSILSEETKEKLNINFDQYFWNLLVHDFSKLSVLEIVGYSGWNFKDETGDKEAMNIAWNHHIKNNPHHPEYWFCPNRDGSMDKVGNMPPIYVLEMVADWIGAGKVYGNSIEDWLPKNIGTFNFSQETKEALKLILKDYGFNETII